LIDFFGGSSADQNSAKRMIAAESAAKMFLDGKGELLLERIY
jgi:hypothetical protein